MNAPSPPILTLDLLQEATARADQEIERLVAIYGEDCRPMIVAASLDAFTGHMKSPVGQFYIKAAILDLHRMEMN